MVHFLSLNVWYVYYCEWNYFLIFAIIAFCFMYILYSAPTFSCLGLYLCIAVETRVGCRQTFWLHRKYPWVDWPLSSLSCTDLTWNQQCSWWLFWYIDSFWVLCLHLSEQPVQKCQLHSVKGCHLIQPNLTVEMNQLQAVNNEQSLPDVSRDISLFRVKSFS